MLIAAATTFLALQGRRRLRPPRPLREWALFVAAGFWAAVIVLYRILDRPGSRSAARRALRPALRDLRRPRRRG